VKNAHLAAAGDFYDYGEVVRAGTNGDGGFAVGGGERLGGFSAALIGRYHATVGSADAR
jgi:hypothetical protein